MKKCIIEWTNGEKEEITTANDNVSDRVIYLFIDDDTTVCLPICNIKKLTVKRVMQEAKVT